MSFNNDLKHLQCRLKKAYRRVAHLPIPKSGPPCLIYIWMCPLSFATRGHIPYAAPIITHQMGIHWVHQSSGNYFTSSDPHHDMLGGGCQVRVVIENMMGRMENLRTLISGFLGLVILVRWALVTMFLSWTTQTGCRIHRTYVSLIGSGEGRHTTHLLKCVPLLSTSQTDWKQSSDVLSDISFDILSDISSDIFFWHIFWHSFWHIFWHSFWHLSDISSDIFFWHIFWHSFWHIFWHSFWHIFWHSFWQIFWHSFWHIFWHIFPHAFWHIFWHSFWHIKTKT